MEEQKLIQSLHPDRYPFTDTPYDLVSDGLPQAGIDTGKLWRGVERNLTQKGRADLALMYGYGSPAENTAGFLAHYALTKYDIRGLNRSQ